MFTADFVERLLVLLNLASQELTVKNIIALLSGINVK
jgi:hypothetical protein